MFRKIPLINFIHLLNSVYQSGADFIDLKGIRNDQESQYEVGISVPLEYMTPDTPEKEEFTSTKEMIETLMDNL